MTEKRFEYVAFDGFTDNGEYITPHEVADLLNELAEENEQLKTRVTAYLQDIEIFKEHNTQLQIRNNRQAETMGEMYTLIAKEEWVTLQKILEEFKITDKQLEKEFRCYE